MKKVNLAVAISLIVLSIPVLFISCKKENPKACAPDTTPPQLPSTPYNYASKHGVDNNLATLGRVLFYDKNLSVNNVIACGSCHKQEYAFADNVKFNKGANGLNLKRNSPSIQGIKGFAAALGFSNSNVFSAGQIPGKDNQVDALLFWDGRQRSVPDMVLNPVLNHNEMNLPDFATLEKRLSDLPYYSALFQSAYGDPTVTKEKIAYALEGFLACLNTTTAQPNSSNMNDIDTFSVINIDQTILTNQPTQFATLEDEGKFLFHSKYNCATCHDPSNTGSYGTVTSPSQMFNIGLDEVYTDNGLGALTGLPGDKGVFKVPTLKNISLTAPYMHDGRFSNLGEVLDHYSHNIKSNPNLSSRFLNFDGTPKKLNILPDEKKALIAFLNTLVDEDFVTSPMYSNPFKK